MRGRSPLADVPTGSILDMWLPAPYSQLTRVWCDRWSWAGSESDGERMLAVSLISTGQVLSYILPHGEIPSSQSSDTRYRPDNLCPSLVRYRPDNLSPSLVRYRPDNLSPSQIQTRQSQSKSHTGQTISVQVRYRPDSQCEIQTRPSSQWKHDVYKQTIHRPIALYDAI